jgi:hypothetical protein
MFCFSEVKNKKVSISHINASHFEYSHSLLAVCFVRTVLNHWFLRGSYQASAIPGIHTSLLIPMQAHDVDHSSTNDAHDESYELENSHRLNFSV